VAELSFSTRNEFSHCRYKADWCQSHFLDGFEPERWSALFLDDSALLVTVTGTLQPAWIP
jgi:hypothetical protein